MNIQVKNLDRLGIVAGIIDQIGLVIGLVEEIDRQIEKPIESLKMAYGYSKDHRPDFK